MTRQQFEARYLQTLNPQQKQAVQTVNGPVLLLAVPGSGKTTVLVTRLGYLVYCCGIAPNQILTMTYTVAATGEMQQRFTKLFGPEYAANMEFCTINGLSNRIVQYYARHHGRREPFDVISSEDSTDIITKLYRDINHEFPTNSMINTTRSNISYIKNKMLTPEEIEQMEGVDNLPALYRAYCSELKQRALMDYDDQLSYALTILKTIPMFWSISKTATPTCV